MSRSSVALAIAALCLACGGQDDASRPDTTAQAAPAPQPLSAGEAYLAVPGGRIWYRKTGTGSATPVILVHGGPGYSSYYLKSLEALDSDRVVVRYDQLGGGKSDRISDTTLFTIAHFVNELDSLRAALGFEKFHLLGHSWGTILGLEYYRAHSERVVSLTLGSAALDIPAWERNAKRLVKTLSDSSQQAIARREAEKNFAAPDYQKAMEEFYGKYAWRHPVPADLDSTIATVNMAIYTYMQGPSEFTITGTLKTYDATPFLREVKVPTLFTVGEFDEADPPMIRRHAAMVPGAKVEVIPGAAHITTWDNPAAMRAAVRSFLASVDARSGAGPRP